MAESASILETGVAMVGDLRSYPERMTVFRENFAKWTHEQLLPYYDNWVAFSWDGTRILAYAPDVAEVGRQLEVAGIDADDVVFSSLFFADGSDCGGADLTCD